MFLCVSRRHHSNRDLHSIAPPLASCSGEEALRFHFLIFFKCKMQHEDDEIQYELTNREFRNIYRRIMGDTKTQVNIRQAYTVSFLSKINTSSELIRSIRWQTRASEVFELFLNNILKILNCSGRNVTSDHLLKQWEYLNGEMAYYISFYFSSLQKQSVLTVSTTFTQKPKKSSWMRKITRKRRERRRCEWRMLWELWRMGLWWTDSIWNISSRSTRMLMASLTSMRFWMQRRTRWKTSLISWWVLEWRNTKLSSMWVMFMSFEKKLNKHYSWKSVGLWQFTQKLNASPTPLTWISRRSVNWLFLLLKIVRFKCLGINSKHLFPHLQVMFRGIGSWTICS